MKNKRAWIRIAESVFAILILVGVLLLLVNKNAERTDLSETIYDLQISVLGDIAKNYAMRVEVLNGNDEIDGKLYTFVDDRLPNNLDFEIRVCNLDGGACQMQSEVFNINTDIFVEERMISAILVSGGSDELNPKKIRLFVWEKNGG